MSKPDTAHLHFREARYLVLDNRIIEYVDHQILFLCFTSAIAVGCLGTLFFVPHQRTFLRFCVIVLGVNFIVGIAGLFLHLTVDLQAPGVTQMDKFLYGAPLFAPLLFPNLSLLAFLGIWKMSARESI